MPRVSLIQHGNRVVAVSGAALRATLGLPLARELAQAAGPAIAGDPAALFRARWTDFAAALAVLPDAAELAFVSAPTGADDEASAALLVLGHGESPNTAILEARRAWESFRRIRHVLADVCDLEDIVREPELMRFVSCLTPGSAAEVRRRHDEIRLGDGSLARDAVGFGAPRDASRAPSGTGVRHLYPWVPGDDCWRRLYEALRTSSCGAALVVRARGEPRAPASVRDEAVAAVMAAERACGDVSARGGTGILAGEAELLRNEAVLRLAALDAPALAVRVFLTSDRAPPPALSAVVQTALDDATAESDRPGASTLFRGGAVWGQADPSDILRPLDDAGLDLWFSPREAPAALRSPYPSDEPVSGVGCVRARRIFAGRPRPAGTTLGTASANGEEIPVRLDLGDRFRHTYVVGQTGTGKSTLLLNMILQDIAAGHGVAVLDPHGALVEAVLDRMPASRADDVILVDPMDAEHPVAMNPLVIDAADSESYVRVRDRVIDDFLAHFERMYDMKVAGGPMFETYFRGMMTLLLGSRPPEAGRTPNLMMLRRVFHDADLRKSLRARSAGDLLLDSLISEMERIGSGDLKLEHVAPYITSKLNRFVSDTLLRRMTCQSRSVRFADVVNRRKVLLADLARGRLGHHASGLLAAMIVGSIRDAAVARGTGPGTPPAFLYVDEFQALADERFAEILAEARKFRLGLVVAHQFVQQIPAAVLHAVMGNVGTLVALRVGAPDAEFLEPHFAPRVLRADLAGQPSHQAYVRISGRADDVVASVAIPPAPEPAPESASIRAAIVARTRTAWSRPRTDVDAEIAATWQAFGGAAAATRASPF